MDNLGLKYPDSTEDDLLHIFKTDLFNPTIICLI